MRYIFRLIVAVGVLSPVIAQARETTPGTGRARVPVEVCEAFPWDVPVEQSFTVASVSRWHQTARGTRLKETLGPPARSSDTKWAGQSVAPFSFGAIRHPVTARRQHLVFQ